MSTAQPAHTETNFITDPKHQRRVLIAMLTALIAVIASVSGLNVTQTQLALDLGASQSQILWIINAYTLALAALLMPIGAIGDRWGRKPVLLAGLAVFGGASLLAAVAQSVELMIGARAVAGLGAAMIMPVTLSVLTSTFPPESRGKAVGLWAGFAGTGGILGMFWSAFMVDAFDWRWLFTLPIAMVTISAAFTLRNVPNSSEGGERFDIGGSILSALAIGGLVLGIHEGPERGWGDWLTLTGLVVGGVALVGFIWWELREREPLLDVRLFRDRNLASSTLTLVIIFALMFGMFLVVFPFFQAVLGWSALRSAVALLPMAVAMMPMSTLAPQIAARIGRRPTVMVGVATMGAGLVAMALRASVDGGYLSVLPGLVLLGLGMGLTMTPSTEGITEALPLEKQGVASALNDTSREVGGAVGIALLGSILSAGYRSSVESVTEGLPDELAEPVEEGIGGALAVSEQLGADGEVVIAAARSAFVDGWVQSMWVAAAMAAVALAYVIVRGPTDPSKSLPVANDEHPEPVGG
ncbi:MAG: MFS transporter [Pseudomonadota bacterium]